MKIINVTCPKCGAITHIPKGIYGTFPKGTKISCGHCAYWHELKGLKKMEKFVEDQSRWGIQARCPHTQTDIDIDNIIFDTTSECGCRSELFVKIIELCIRCGKNIYKKRCVMCGKWSKLTPIETLRAKEEHLMRDYHNRIETSRHFSHGDLSPSIINIKKRMLMDVLDLRGELPLKMSPHEEEYKIREKLHTFGHTLALELLEWQKKPEKQKEPEEHAKLQGVE